MAVAEADRWSWRAALALAGTALAGAAYAHHTSKVKRCADEHERIAAAALNVMVQASAKHLPVPPLNATQISPTRGWSRCMEAMAGVQLMLSNSHSVDVGANDQVLVSACKQVIYIPGQLSFPLQFVFNPVTLS
jgi:hypothetical protein